MCLVRENRVASKLLVTTRPSRLGNDARQLIDLPLRTTESTEPLLGQLSRTLILAVSQQFDDSSLVGCQAGDFLDDLAHKGRPLGEGAFAAGDAGCWGERCDFMAFVQAHGKAGLFNAFFRHLD